MKIDIQGIGCVSTDGAPVMLGKIKIFFTDETGGSTLARYSLFPSLSCFGIKILFPILKKVLDISVKPINWIRGRPLNHRLFKTFKDRKAAFWLGTLAIHNLLTDRARELFNFKPNKEAEILPASIKEIRAVLGLNFLWCDVMTGGG